MNTPELISKLKQAEQGAVNIKAAPDKKRRDQAIDTLVAYLQSIRKGLEEDAS